jgi:hypothetical protein
VVGFTTGSRGELAREKYLTRNNDDDDDTYERM